MGHYADQAAYYRGVDTAGERFGARLRGLRKARGWTQDELSERANMSLKGVGAIERGHRFPRETTVEALADALQVTVDELTGALLPEAIPRPAPPVRPPKDEVPPEIQVLLTILKGRPTAVVRAVSAVARVMADEFDRLNSPKESA